MHKRAPTPFRLTILSTALFASLLAPVAQAAGVNTLTGWAMLPAATFSDGPTSGQFAFTNATHLARTTPSS